MTDRICHCCNAAGAKCECGYGLTQPNLTRGDELTSAQLRECPFCGSPAGLEQVGSEDNGFRWSVGCNGTATDAEGEPECIGYMALTTYPRKCEAIAAWNTRAPAVQPAAWLDESGNLHRLFPRKIGDENRAKEAAERGWTPLYTAILPERDSALRQAVREARDPSVVGGHHSTDWIFNRERELLARPSGADGEKV